MLTCCELIRSLYSRSFKSTTIESHTSQTGSVLTQASLPVLPVQLTMTGPTTPSEIDNTARSQLEITNVKNEENGVNLIEDLNGDVLPLILKELNARSIYDFSESLGLIDNNIRSKAITVFSNELIKSVNDATDAKKEAAFEESLSQVPDELIFGVIDTLSELANTIGDNPTEDLTLITIALGLAKKYPDQVNKAVEIANAITDITFNGMEGKKYHTLLSIATQFAQNNPDRVDKAVEIANTIEHNFVELCALQTIATQLAQNNPDRVDKAVEIANTIEPPFYKDDTLNNIAKQLAKEYPDRINKAFEIANTIGNGYLMDNALEAIFNQLAQNNLESNRQSRSL
jgi:uncharacterized protein YdaT